MMRPPYCLDRNPIYEFQAGQLLCLGSHNDCQIVVVILGEDPFSNYWYAVAIVDEVAGGAPHDAYVGDPVHWHLYNRSPVR
jgi:hypothetical protein